MVRVFLAEFSEAVNVQCFRHFIRTIVHRLGEWKKNDKSEVKSVFL